MPRRMCRGVICLRYFWYNCGVSKKNYPIRIPRFAAGIRAQEPRAGGGRTWWGRRWIETLERMGLGARLGRGKNYAVSGQVTEMRLAGPHVEASVVGVREDPYGVTVDFRVPEGAAREAIVAAIRKEPILAARLLADDMPTEIESRGNRAPSAYAFGIARRRGGGAV